MKNQTLKNKFNIAYADNDLPGFKILIKKHTWYLDSHDLAQVQKYADKLEARLRENHKISTAIDILGY